MVLNKNRYQMSSLKSYLQTMDTIGQSLVKEDRHCHCQMNTNAWFEQNRHQRNYQQWYHMMMCPNWWKNIAKFWKTEWIIWRKWNGIGTKQKQLKAYEIYIHIYKHKPFKHEKTQFVKDQCEKTDFFFHYLKQIRTFRTECMSAQRYIWTVFAICFFKLIFQNKFITKTHE